MTRQTNNHAGACQLAAIQTLVISQHEAVRRQLVAYLSRSPALDVTGEPFSSSAILRAHPDVLVLDLSQLGQAGLYAAIDASRQVGARLIALASIGDPADEAAVLAVGGTYRLKAAGADGLAELVRGAVRRRTLSQPPAAS